jgi:hypothetical protein
MAEFNYLTNLAPQIQPMNIGGMLDLARGVQAYQQAQELNPLAVQTAQQQLYRLQQLTPEEIKRAKAEANVAAETERTRIEEQLAKTKTAQIGEKKAGFELDGAQNQAMFNVVGGIINDPGLTDPKKVFSVLNQAKERAKNLIKSDPDAEQKVDGVFAPLFKYAKDEPGSVPQVIKNIIQQGTGATGQQALQTPQMGTVAGQAASFVPGQNAVQALAFPEQTAPAAVAEPSQMPLPYPVRKPGVPFAPFQGEEADRQKNQQYRQGLVSRLPEMSNSRRNLDETISAATKLGPGEWWSSGVAGTLKRKASELIGDPTYKQLSKDLANVQISNIQATGGSMDTVAGQNLMKLANGDETYPPDVLINIARRTYAQMTDLEMQAKGAEAFARRNGDQNLNAYKQMWAKNADSRVFEAISIYNNVKDPAQRKKAIDDLLGSDTKSREAFAEKYRNIKKLSETGEL